MLQIFQDRREIITWGGEADFWTIYVVDVNSILKEK